MAKSITWNPWHGCTKISAGCANCYVYRGDKTHGIAVASDQCRKNASFNLPVSKKADGSYKIEGGTMIFTCFTSDFLLSDADEWRQECWRMIKERSDCPFCFLTKRIDRLQSVLPLDWGDGYENVMIGCTCENQDRADFRLPIFLETPIKHRIITAEPLLGPVHIEKYLRSGLIEEVVAGGESGKEARVCNYDWVRSLQAQAMEHNVSFSYHQTGAKLIKDEHLYRVPRDRQHEQARKAGLNYTNPNRPHFLLAESKTRQQQSLFGE